MPLVPFVASHRSFRPSAVGSVLRFFPGRVHGLLEPGDAVDWSRVGPVMSNYVLRGFDDGRICGCGGNEKPSAPELSKEDCVSEILHC